jgi:hypothetical protein
MNAHHDEEFKMWLAVLTALAADGCHGWAIDPTGASHRATFDAGGTPEEELLSIVAMAEWRGCGCGGV